MTAPIARADSAGRGPSRSKETATATAATTATFIIPPTSRTVIRPRQHRPQFMPKRTPCSRQLAASPLAGARQARHTANWRAFHALTWTAPARSSAAPVASGDAAATLLHGVRFGMNCGLCCLGLMTVLLVGGMMKVAVVAAVAVAVSLERLGPRPALSARAIGGVMMAMGAVVVVRSCN